MMAFKANYEEMDSYRITYISEVSTSVFLATCVILILLHQNSCMEEKRYYPTWCMHVSKIIFKLLIVIMS